MFLLNLFMHNEIFQPAVYIIITRIVHCSYKVFVRAVSKNCIFLNFHESRKVRTKMKCCSVSHLGATVHRCPIIRI